MNVRHCCQSRIPAPVLAASLVLGLLSATTALADGLYTRVVGGATWLGNESLDLSAPAPTSADGDYAAGWMSAAAVGWQRDDWRVEAEIGYRRNGVDEADFTDGRRFSDGDFASLGFGATVLREFDLLGDERVRSYLGAGVVWLEEVDLDLERSGVESSFSDSAVAGQLIAGARYALWERWELYAEYRFLYAGSLDLDGEGGAAGQVESDYAHHGVAAGIGYRF
ncbi:MAG: outer membrane protein [Gammaproteobacteria bacterium]